jgi:hypothetical protein
VDVNNALVSAILTGYAGFTTSAGHVGPHFRVDHDISMLAPEIWCRMTVEERDPRFLIERGFLEKLEDYDFQGRTVRAGRLGYRITAPFVDHFLGRIFEMPNAVFPEEMLRPEKQDPAVFAAGVDSIVEAQELVARNYFEDGSLEAACPPVRALLEIMATGHSNGMTAKEPALRAMFTRECLLSSGWYKERLRVKQERDVRLWRRHLAAVEDSGGAQVNAVLEQLNRVSSESYLEELTGTIGADPFYKQMSM